MTRESKAHEPLAVERPREILEQLNPPLVDLNELVEGAQEALARLNRLHFKAPPHPGVAALLDQLKAPGEQRPAAALHRVGLSGSPAAPAVLLDLVAKEPDENRRAALIEWRNPPGRVQKAPRCGIDQVPPG